MAVLVVCCLTLLLAGQVWSPAIEGLSHDVRTMEKLLSLLVVFQ
jgi:hypothetical protein